MEKRPGKHHGGSLGVCLCICRSSTVCETHKLSRREGRRGWLELLGYVRANAREIRVAGSPREGADPWAGDTMVVMFIWLGRAGR